MKRILTVSALLLLLICACQENELENTDFTGNEIVYPLLPSSIYQVSGSATLKEKKDGSSLIKIQLTGTEGNSEHPVHLHIGDINNPDASILALLNPVKGSTGVSETAFTKLSDETPISYQELIHLNASIKIHLAASGPDRDIILASGNIGSNVSGHEHAGGRVDVSVCRSE